MKKKLFILMIISITFFISNNVYALNYTRVTSGGTTTMTGPGTGSKSTVLKYNDVVPIYYTTYIAKKTDTCPSGWYKINLNGDIRYICKTDIKTNAKTVLTKESNLNIRLGAGTGNSVFENVGKNKLLTLANTTKYSGSGCSGGWYRLDYAKATNRYICSNYVSVNNTPNVVVTNRKGTIIRSEASSKSSNIETIKYGQALTLRITSKYKGSGCSAGWYQVMYRAKVRYVCSSDVYRTNDIYVIDATDYINVRESSNTSSDIITTIGYTEPIALMSTSKTSGSGCSAGWLKIHVNGKTGYVCSTYVSNAQNFSYTNTTTYVKSSASSSSNTIATLSKDKLVNITSLSTYKGNGCSTGWYRIHIDGGSGYICSSNTDLGKTLNGENTATNTESESGNETVTKPNTGSGSSSSSNDSMKVTAVKTSSSYYYSANKWEYRVSETYANVRSSATTSSSVKDVLYQGADVEVLGSYTGSGCSAGWYKIKYYTNRTGYICKSLVNKYSDITKTDNTYCSTLKAKGFPESYCPYLSYLHAKHPNWEFIPEKTGVSFLAAVNGESEKNYTQITYSAYLQSSTIRESGGWRTASDGYVAFMIDPRNYLTEKNIFAFEDLSYDSKYHTINAIRSMVSGSYLDDPTYAGYFLDAGKTYKVSPVHLAARVKQEGGTNKNYDSVSGKSTYSCSFTTYVCSTYVDTKTKKITNKYGVNLRSGPGTNYYVTTTGLDGESFTFESTKKYSGSGCPDGWYNIKITRSLAGIYNYYNIGAYGSNPVLRGLKTAAGCLDSNDGTPWNTREKAIKYGASFIANGYINKGQNTLYYQKFNTGPNALSSRYTHQYMTNILAPTTEGESTYESYKSLGLLNKVYAFKIPVYNSMPNATVHPPVK